MKQEFQIPKTRLEWGESKQRSANFFCKEAGSKYFWFCGPMLTIIATQLCYSMGMSMFKSKNFISGY